LVPLSTVETFVVVQEASVYGCLVPAVLVVPYVYAAEPSSAVFSAPALVRCAECEVSVLRLPSAS
jgi:hypothetical protein